MGSKGASPPPVDTSMFTQASQANQQQLQAYQDQLQRLNSEYNAQMEQFQTAELPQVNEVSAEDWNKRMEELNSKMHADYTLEQEGKKGRLDTITSKGGLLDDEEVPTVSLLS